MKEPTYTGTATAAQIREKLTFPNPCSYTPGNFRKTFRSPFDQYAHRIGHEFTAVRQLEGDDVPEDEFMYRIRFADGVEIDAWGEEVCD